MKRSRSNSALSSSSNIQNINGSGKRAKTDKKWQCTSTLYGPRCDQISRDDNIEYHQGPIFDTELECQESKCFVSSQNLMQVPRMVGLVGEYLDPYTLEEFASHDPFTRMEVASSLSRAEMAKPGVAQAMLANLIKCPDDFKKWFNLETLLVHPREDQKYDHEVAVLAFDMLIDDILHLPSEETRCARDGITRRSFILTDYAKPTMSAPDYNSLVFRIIGDVPSRLSESKVKSLSATLDVSSPGWANKLTPFGIVSMLDWAGSYSPEDVIDEIWREVEKRPEILESRAISRLLPSLKDKLERYWRGPGTIQYKMVEELISRSEQLFRARDQDEYI